MKILILSVTLTLALHLKGSVLQCPDWILPIPARTLNIVSPLTWYKCPNTSTTYMFYHTEFSAEYPLPGTQWLQNCTDSYIWAYGVSLAGDFTSFCCPRWDAQAELPRACWTSSCSWQWPSRPRHTDARQVTSKQGKLLAHDIALAKGWEPLYELNSFIFAKDKWEAM